MTFEMALIRINRCQSQSIGGHLQVWYQTVANKCSYKPSKLQDYKCIRIQVRP